MKKNGAIVLMCACVVAALSVSASARDPLKQDLRPYRSEQAPQPGEFDEFLDPGLREFTEAAVDTYCIVWYTFEQMNWQGWTRFDATAQRGDFWRVDDFAGLGGGSYGGLVPLEGTKSMWCGVRPSTTDPYICSWHDAPGCGNFWAQNLATGAFNFAGSITLSYLMHYDSEPDYDFTRVEYDAGGNDWRLLAEYTGDSGSLVLRVESLPSNQKIHKLIAKTGQIIECKPPNARKRTS